MGELIALPRPPADLRGPTSKGEGGREGPLPLYANSWIRPWLCALLRAIRESPTSFRRRQRRYTTGPEIGRHNAAVRPPSASKQRAHLRLRHAALRGPDRVRRWRRRAVALSCAAMRAIVDPTRSCIPRANNRRHHRRRRRCRCRCRRHACCSVSLDAQSPHATDRHSRRTDAH